MLRPGGCPPALTSDLPGSFRFLCLCRSSFLLGSDFLSPPYLCSTDTSFFLKTRLTCSLLCECILDFLHYLEGELVSACTPLPRAPQWLSSLAHPSLCELLEALAHRAVSYLCLALQSGWRSFRCEVCTGQHVRNDLLSGWSGLTTWSMLSQDLSL